MVDKPSDAKGLVDGNAVVHERKRSAEKGVVDVCFKIMNFFLRNKLCRRLRRTKKGTTTTYINNRATMMPALVGYTRASLGIFKQSLLSR